MHLALWYVVLVCHQYDVCENSVGSVYIGGYGGLSESGLCVFQSSVNCVQLCCCCLTTPTTLASGGESDVPACGPSASFSVHLASSAVTPAGSIHKSRGDNVVRMWVRLKR